MNTADERFRILIQQTNGICILCFARLDFFIEFFHIRCAQCFIALQLTKLFGYGEHLIIEFVDFLIKMSAKIRLFLLCLDESFR